LRRLINLWTTSLHSKITNESRKTCLKNTREVCTIHSSEWMLLSA
jgi:hypothetical protein